MEKMKEKPPMINMRIRMMDMNSSDYIKTARTGHGIIQNRRPK